MARADDIKNDIQTIWNHITKKGAKPWVVDPAPTMAEAVHKFLCFQTANLLRNEFFYDAVAIKDVKVLKEWASNKEEEIEIPFSGYRTPQQSALPVYSMVKVTVKPVGTDLVKYEIVKPDDNFGGFLMGIKAE